MIMAEINSFQISWSVNTQSHQHQSNNTEMHRNQVSRGGPNTQTNSSNDTTSSNGSSWGGPVEPDDGSSYDLKSYEPSSGKATLENDRYTINIDESSSEIEVIDKQNPEDSFRIYGDPHFDIGNDGDTDFDFKKDMSIELDDGTKLHIHTTPTSNGETLATSLAIEEPDGSGWYIEGIDSDQKGDLEVKEYNNINYSGGTVNDDAALELQVRDGNYFLNSDNGWETLEEDKKASNDAIVNDIETAIKNQPWGISNQEDFLNDMYANNPNSRTFEDYLSSVKEMFEQMGITSNNVNATEPDEKSDREKVLDALSLLSQLYNTLNNMNDRINNPNQTNLGDSIKNVHSFNNDQLFGQGQNNNRGVVVITIRAA
ncbi:MULTISPECIES: DUF1521 domain-containing protein [Vibrio]|uniref:DUF1521 domain-containing protein n=1 Tax=Vibrio TaxID=662 RepID=UPI0001B953F1|nr:MULTISPECIES: DUF1521 domain-containing protein [Vibrio]EEX34258.1 hypothetical protein VIC_001052 [Vibrio coralliilyticus ATCC BAA-450]MDE3898669.1 DUF1521 domain-containing protein [Vibrio sp. CC007]